MVTTSMLLTELEKNYAEKSAKQASDESFYHTDILLEKLKKDALASRKIRDAFWFDNNDNKGVFYFRLPNKRIYRNRHSRSSANDNKLYDDDDDEEEDDDNSNIIIRDVQSLMSSDSDSEEEDKKNNNKNKALSLINDEAFESDEDKDD